MSAGKAMRAWGSVLLASVAATGWAQQGRQLTTADYARAESFMNYNVNPLVYHSVDRPQWLGDGRFWYRDRSASGTTIMLVDPAKKTKAPAFDQVKLAQALNSANTRGPRFDATRLPITELSLSDGDRTVMLATGMRHWRCDLSGDGTCASTDPAPKDGAVPQAGPRGRAPFEVSPDGKKAAFIRDWNLWVRDTTTGEEKQLTTDGVKDYGYATDNAGWQSSDRPILVWSPDSKKIATFQQDQRKTGEMYLVPVTNGHPKLQIAKYPLVGDKDVTMIERVIVDTETPNVLRLKMPADQHRSMLCDDISCRNGAEWEDVQWSDDTKQLAFVSTSRDHKQEWLRVADVATGDVREVMTETAPKFFEPGNGKSNWRYLSGTNEFLWFSERDGWGQMYLYDGNGKLKNQVTKGDGNVTQVLLIDGTARKIYFLAVGKEKGRDPYFSHYYSINFDGSGMKLLTPENADHAVTPSPDGKYFVDVASTAIQPQTAVVRDTNGELAMDVARQDIAKLMMMGWVPPTPITVKGRDGKTDLYGFMFKPTKFDPSKKYPIVNNVYPGPQTGSCGGRGFTASHRDMQSLAELGFVVVCIDGMGTPWRSKAFHEFYYGNLGDNTIPDQVAGMKDLAKQYPWIDVTKVGIYGHSGGGNATGAAMFNYPDFFKVGISESGNHDQRDYEDDWAERWAGLEEKKADGTSNYDSQANQNIAKNLKGKLLLAHGTMDNNVPPNNTLLVVDALIKANKDFDLLMIPNVQHGYAEASLYMARRRWDYFVSNLAGNIPPKEYKMKSYAETQAAMAGGGPSDDEE